MPPTAAVDAGQPQASVATHPKLVIAFGDKKKINNSEEGI